MRDLLHDVRYALRTLAKTPVFTFLAILTIALGVGANTAVFSLIEAVILNVTPYPKTDRLVRIYQSRSKETATDGTDQFVGFPDYLDFCRSQHTFESLSASFWTFWDLGGQGQRYPERLTGVCATPSLFKVTGLPFQPYGMPFFSQAPQVPGKLHISFFYGLTSAC